MASSTIADIYDTNITTQLTAADDAWTALDLPTTLSTWVNAYTDGTTANELEAFIDILGFDLTDFLTDCATSSFCDDVFIESRYDGLAMVNFLGLGFQIKTTLPTTSADSTLVFCIEEDEQCIGWNFS